MIKYEDDILQGLENKNLRQLGEIMVGLIREACDRDDKLTKAQILRLVMNQTAIVICTFTLPAILLLTTVFPKGWSGAWSLANLGRYLKCTGSMLFRA